MQAVSFRPFLRLALIGVLFTALGLAGCGRKGPLDPPPGASLDGQQQAQPQPEPQQSGLVGPAGASPFGGSSPKSSSGNGAGVTAEGHAQAPKGPNKRIPLDVLLN